MKGDTNLRASDADRDQVAAALREHFAAGRLTINEFHDRLDRAFAAKTLGELADLMADLPGTDLARFAETAARPSAEPVEDQQPQLGGAWPTFWRPWLMISTFFFVLWLADGGSGGPWFVFPVLVSAVVLLRRRYLPPPPPGDHQVGMHRDHHQLGG